MYLFDNFHDNLKNMLPEDGTANYYGKVLTQKQAHIYYNCLLTNIKWENDEIIIFGKKIVTRRKVAWYADRPLKYTYSNSTKFALPWTKELMDLKQLVEQKSGETYNSCLLNLYHNGSEGMGWHSDNEKELKKYGAIASLSLGAERRFAFKHKKTKKVVSIQLEHGSLLIMKDEIQNHWLHRLPPTKRVNTSRINLTFRTIIE
ncbi:MAG: alpha-ketoglutarate-dependent dioxygenase AlkB [Flavobacteriales bacterium]|nr:MAG: alpha-ketoglutarate-dependent dioxygenase AlkB [Flavobacteriales bacterium]